MNNKATKELVAQLPLGFVYFQKTFSRDGKTFSLSNALKRPSGTKMRPLSLFKPKWCDRK